jgi:hypothetical protein
MTIKKEMIVAIFIGLFLGAIVAFSFVKFNISIKPNAVSQVTPALSPTQIVQSAKSQIPLDVLFPTNQTWTEEKEITVTGKTAPNSLVVVTTAKSEGATKSNTDGSFSIPVTLGLGANEVLITVLVDNVQKDRLVLVNYYDSKEK